MKVRTDGFEFDFPGALEAYVFDEKDKAQPRFHGLSHAMKTRLCFVFFIKYRAEIKSSDHATDVRASATEGVV